MSPAAHAALPWRCALACALLLAPRAHAENAAVVPVTLRGTSEPLLVELYHPSSKVGLDLPIARCRTPCLAHLARGSYRLFVHGTSDTREGERIIEVTSPTALEVDPDSNTQRPAGLALAIASNVALVVGLVLLVTNSDTCGGSCTHRGSTAAADAGGVLVLGSLVGIPVGWVMFGRSFHPDVETKPLPSGFASGGRGPALGPEPRVVGLGLRASF